jgi:hypothetical protein
MLKLMPSKKDMVRETKRNNWEEKEIGTNKDAICEHGKTANAESVGWIKI